MFSDYSKIVFKNDHIGIRIFRNSPGRRRNVSEMINNDECVVLGGQCEIMDEKTKKIKYITKHKELITKSYLKKNAPIWFINHPTIMYKKDIILKIGPYNEKLKGHSEDTYLWIQLIMIDCYS